MAPATTWLGADRSPQRFLTFGFGARTLFCAALWWLCAFAPARADCADPAACQCTQSNSYYEANHYRVSKVRIESLFGKKTPLGFILGGQKGLLKQFDAVRTRLPLKEGGKFTVAQHILAQDSVRAEFGAPDPDERLRFVLIAGDLENCDGRASPPSLEVVYRVVSTEGVSYFTQIFERRPDKITRALLPGALARAENKLLPQPYAGYNRSRSLFGGTRLSLVNDDRLVNRLDADFSGSGSSAEAALETAGSRDFKRGALSHVEWRLGYRYSDIPSDAVRLKGGTGAAQVFGATHPLGDHGLLLRFGGSVEGGNRLTNLPQSAVPDGSPVRSPHGAVKAYIGGTMNRGRQAMTASYGLQLGQAGDEVRVDYVKHLFDAAYNLRFLPREHKPFRLDLQLNAGFIQSASGRAPIAERFFGGNVQDEFIRGDDWLIRTGPLIRSFPQNRLNRIGAGAPIGGTNFFSVNLTLAQTVWSVPAIPAEISRSADVRTAFAGQITSAREATKASYLSETDEFLALKEKYQQTVLAELTAFEAAVRALGPSDLSEDADPDDLEDFQEDADDALQLLKKGGPAFDILAARSLLVGFETTSGVKFPSKIGALVNTANEDYLPPPEEPCTTEKCRNLRRATTALDAKQVAIAALKPEFDRVLALAPVSAEELRPALQKAQQLIPVLDSVQEIIGDIEDGFQDPPTEAETQIESVISPINTYAGAAGRAVTSAQSAQDGGKPDEAKNNLELLAVGYSEVAPAMLVGIIDAIRDAQKSLTMAGHSEQVARLEAKARELSRLRDEIKKLLKDVRVSSIERKANRDVAYTGRVLDVVFKELNLIAVSPVFMFDAARIGPRNNAQFGGMRYGVGGGVRFSIVSLDFTSGYSWNPNRRSSEGRGAFVFSMDVSDLFR